MAGAAGYRAGRISDWVTSFLSDRSLSWGLLGLLWQAFLIGTLCWVYLFNSSAAGTVRLPWRTLGTEGEFLALIISDQGGTVQIRAQLEAPISALARPEEFQRWKRSDSAPLDLRLMAEALTQLRSLKLRDSLRTSTSDLDRDHAGLAKPTLQVEIVTSSGKELLTFGSWNEFVGARYVLSNGSDSIDMVDDDFYTAAEKLMAADNSSADRSSESDQLDSAELE